MNRDDSDLYMKRALFFMAAMVVFAAGTLQTPAQDQQQATQQPPQIAQFQKIEDQWSSALVKQDQFTLETILSPTFVNISAAGEITSRDEAVAAMFEKGLPQAMTMEQRVVNVRIIEDVAVVDGTYVEQRKLNGVRSEERGVFTHIYQRVREVWVCLQSQRTAVIEQGDDKKKAGRKKSTVALPFHIPLTRENSSSQPTPLA
ncbi:MAG TPA: nuclear transport factor 2 family protein [Silvibacterium sp.]|nr:nuclear transport factor 2 family protein [Silvibacterium sp.]